MEQCPSDEGRGGSERERASLVPSPSFPQVGTLSLSIGPPAFRVDVRPWVNILWRNKRTPLSHQSLSTSNQVGHAFTLTGTPRPAVVVHSQSIFPACVDGSVRERCPQLVIRGPSLYSNGPASDKSNRMAYSLKGTKGMEERALHRCFPRSGKVSAAADNTINKCLWRWLVEGSPRVLRRSTGPM